MFAETHKFESRYLQPLVFGDDLSMPADFANYTEQQKATIAERSPITHAHKIKAPMLIMGGKDVSYTFLSRSFPPNFPSGALH